MRKAIAFILCAAALSVSAFAAPDTSAAAAILIHADTGEVLYEHNADERMLIASTTKIMTALVALERCSTDEEVEIDESAVGREGSSMYLEAGDVYTVEELLYGLMLASGNDAASALAIHIAGSEEDFAALMNCKAAQLGLTGTHFANPHGLDAEGHYSTARDMAALAAYAMQNADFKRIVSSRSALVHGRTIVNHNKLLGMYPGCIGVKTGYTMAAGRTLVSCAERDGERYVCVTLSDRNDWNDHMALYDWSFENFDYVLAADSSVTYRVNAVNGGVPYAGVRAESDAYVLLPAGEDFDIELELPPFVICPVRAGETAGTLRVTRGGEEVCSVRLAYSEDIPALEPTGLLERALGFVQGLMRPIYLTEGSE